MSSTQNIIDSKKLKLMKKTSYLINAARGGLINENDLYKTLSKKILRVQLWMFLKVNHL